MVRKNLVKFLVVLIAIWIVGGCAKKIMPPEVDATGGATGSESSGAGGISEGGAGMGNGSGGISESGAGAGAGAGNGAGAGAGGADFGAGAGAGNGAGGADFGSGTGAGVGGAGAGGAGAGGAGQEARSLDFQPTTDLGDVFFAFDKYDLDDNSKKALQKNADWLKQHPGTKTQIEGHCDERGTNNYNLALGERRALSTKKYLVALGVEDSRIYTISYGEEKPFCMEHKESCWQQNRRGHFLISK